MNKKLAIVGGTYFERWFDPDPHAEALFGSGLRAAAALSDKNLDIDLISCIGKNEIPLLDNLCVTFAITPQFHYINETIAFEYYHPLAPPEVIGAPTKANIIALPNYKANCVLYYGMIEASVAVEANYLVYDPQNHISFTETGSSAEHLALVLNKKEAYLITGADEDVSLREVGKKLLTTQGAEVVVIKNGSNGATVIDSSGYSEISVYETSHVWPIGSGDIFSAVFAWKWAIESLTPVEAAQLASRYTATFCQTKNLPLPSEPLSLSAISKRTNPKKIYLAGPFFTMGQRWLINEFLIILSEFGNDVFSPFHHVGQPKSKSAEAAVSIATQDLSAIKEADLILAIVCDHDPGTLFEIGFAQAIGKEILVFTENVSDEDLLMLVGTKCKIVNDFSTAVYMASW